MAEKDLNQKSGNDTLSEMLSKMPLKKNLKGNAYGQQSKAPFSPTTKVVKSGWKK